MKYLILFSARKGGDADWEEFEGTLEEAIAEATCSGRHLNYGRTGVRVIEMGKLAYQEPSVALSGGAQAA